MNSKSDVTHLIAWLKERFEYGDSRLAEAEERTLRAVLRNNRDNAAETLEILEAYHRGEIK